MLSSDPIPNNPGGHRYVYDAFHGRLSVPGEAPGEFFGAGAEKLGLVGEITAANAAAVDAALRFIEQHRALKADQPTD